MDVLHFQTRAWWQKILPVVQNVTKTSFAKNLGRREAVQDPGLATHMMKQWYWKLSSASVPEGLAVGEESTHGALQGILEGLGGRLGVDVREENVRGEY